MYVTTGVTYKWAMHHRQFVFTVHDFAKAFGMPEVLVRRAIRKGEFDPSSLPSVCRYWTAREGQAIDAACRQAASALRSIDVL